MNPNPFTEAKYNIFESPLWTNCEDVNKKSRILDTTIENPQLYEAIYNKDLFFIEKYIHDEIDQFANNMYLVKMCDEYVFMRDLNKDLKMPEECKIFTNYQVFPDSHQLKYDSYSENPFTNIEYAKSYIDSQKRFNDKKPMCQRYADLNQMMDDYTNIIKTFDTPEIKSNFKDEYENLMLKQEENLEKRNELNKKLTEFYESESSKMMNSKLNLDSTVYTSVLWTIAATTLLFYVFRKL